MFYLLNVHPYYRSVIEKTQPLSEGKLNFRQTYDHAKRIIKEEFFYNDELLHSATFVYDEKNNIIESTDYNSQGEVLLQQEYIYHQDHSLWEIIQKDNLSLYQGNQVYSFEQNNNFLIDYYHEGFLTRSQTYHARMLVLDKNYIYKDGYLVQTTMRNLSDFSQIIEFYNTDQLLTARTFLKKGQFLENEEYFYQDRQLTSKVVEDQEGAKTEEKYFYHDDGSLAQTDFYKGEQLYKTIVYINKDLYLIQYYAFGQVRMIETYENDILVKQEFPDQTTFP